MNVERGVTRTVIVTRRWAFKLPGGLKSKRSMFWIYPVRGYLANRSEWRQRRRPDVARPVATLGHLVLVMPAADRIADENDDYPAVERYLSDVESDDRDEQKPSSWGLFGSRWLLVDYDRAWHQQDRGLVGAVYYGRQERLARKWMRLPTEEPS